MTPRIPVSVRVLTDERFARAAEKTGLSPRGIVDAALTAWFRALDELSGSTLDEIAALRREVAALREQLEYDEARIMALEVQHSRQ